MVVKNIKNKTSNDLKDEINSDSINNINNLNSNIIITTDAIHKTNNFYIKELLIIIELLRTIVNNIDIRRTIINYIYSEFLEKSKELIKNIELISNKYITYLSNNKDYNVNTIIVFDSNSQDDNIITNKEKFINQINNIKSEYSKEVFNLLSVVYGCSAYEPQSPCNYIFLNGKSSIEVSELSLSQAKIKPSSLFFATWVYFNKENLKTSYNISKNTSKSSKSVCNLSNNFENVMEIFNIALGKKNNNRISILVKSNGSLYFKNINEEIFLGCNLEVDSWNFVSFSLKSKGYFSKTEINFYINNTIKDIYINLESDNEIKTISLFSNLICRVTSVIISKAAISKSSIIELKDQYKLGIFKETLLFSFIKSSKDNCFSNSNVCGLTEYNKGKNLENDKIASIFESMLIFYTTCRCHKVKSYDEFKALNDFSSVNSGMLKSTIPNQVSFHYEGYISNILGSTIINYKKVYNNIFYLGGINNLLPMVEHMIYNNMINQPDLIHSLFNSLIFNIINERKENIKCLLNENFFEMLSLFVEKLDSKYFNTSIMNDFKSIGKSLFYYADYSPLLFKFCTYILLNEKILTKFNISNQNEIWKVIDLFSVSDFNQFNSLISFQKLVYFLKYYDSKYCLYYCCSYHKTCFINTCKKKEHFNEAFNINNVPELKNIIKNKFSRFSNDDCLEGKILIETISMNISPCFQLFIIKLIINYLITSSIVEQFKINLILKLSKINFVDVLLHVYSNSLLDVKCELLKLFKEICTYKDYFNQNNIYENKALTIINNFLVLNNLSASVIPKAITYTKTTNNKLNENTKPYVRSKTPNFKRSINILTNNSSYLIDLETDKNISIKDNNINIKNNQNELKLEDNINNNVKNYSKRKSSNIVNYIKKFNNNFNINNTNSENSLNTCKKILVENLEDINNINSSCKISKKKNIKLNYDVSMIPKNQNNTNNNLNNNKINTNEIQENCNFNNILNDEVHPETVNNYKDLDSIYEDSNNADEIINSAIDSNNDKYLDLEVNSKSQSLENKNLSEYNKSPQDLQNISDKNTSLSPNKNQNNLDKLYQLKKSSGSISPNKNKNEESCNSIKNTPLVGIKKKAKEKQINNYLNFKKRISTNIKIDIEQINKSYKNNKGLNSSSCNNNEIINMEDRIEVLAQHIVDVMDGSTTACNNSTIDSFNVRRATFLSKSVRGLTKINFNKLGTNIVLDSNSNSVSNKDSKYITPFSFNSNNKHIKNDNTFKHFVNNQAINEEENEFSPVKPNDKSNELNKNSNIKIIDIDDIKNSHLKENNLYKNSSKKKILKISATKIKSSPYQESYNLKNIQNINNNSDNDNEGVNINTMSSDEETFSLNNINNNLTSSLKRNNKKKVSRKLDFCNIDYNINNAYNNSSENYNTNQTSNNINLKENSIKNSSLELFKKSKISKNINSCKTILKLGNNYNNSNKFLKINNDKNILNDCNNDDKYLIRQFNSVSPRKKTVDINLIKNNLLYKIEKSLKEQEKNNKSSIKERKSIDNIHNQFEKKRKVKNLFLSEPKCLSSSKFSDLTKNYVDFINVVDKVYLKDNIELVYQYLFEWLLNKKSNKHNKSANFLLDNSDYLSYPEILTTLVYYVVNVDKDSLNINYGQRFIQDLHILCTYNKDNSLKILQNEYLMSWIVEYSYKNYLESKIDKEKMGFYDFSNSFHIKSIYNGIINDTDTSCITHINFLLNWGNGIKKKCKNDIIKLRETNEFIKNILNPVFELINSDCPCFEDFNINTNNKISKILVFSDILFEFYTYYDFEESVKKDYIPNLEKNNLSNMDYKLIVPPILFNRFNLRVSSIKEINESKLKNKKKEEIKNFWKDFCVFENIYIYFSKIWYNNEHMQSEHSHPYQKIEHLLQIFFESKSSRNLYYSALQLLTISSEEAYRIFKKQKSNNNLNNISNYNLYYSALFSNTYSSSNLNKKPLDSNKIKFSEKLHKDPNILNIINNTIMIILCLMEDESEHIFWLDQIERLINFVLLGSINLNVKSIEDINIQDKVLETVLFTIGFLINEYESSYKEKADVITIKIGTILKTFFMIIILGYEKIKKTLENKNSNILSFLNKKDNDLKQLAIYKICNEYLIEKSYEYASNTNNYNINTMKSSAISSLFIEECKSCFFANFPDAVVKIKLRNSNFITNKFINFENEQIKNKTKYIFDFMNYLNRCIKRDSEVLCYIDPFIKLSYDNIPRSIRLLRQSMYSDIEKKCLRYLDKYRSYCQDLYIEYKDRIDMFKNVKESKFTWRGPYSKHNLFFTNNVFNLKYEVMNHYASNFTKPLLKVIADIEEYIPYFSKYNRNDIFIDCNDYKNLRICDLLVEENLTKINSNNCYYTLNEINFVKTNFEYNYYMNFFNYLADLYKYTSIGINNFYLRFEYYFENTFDNEMYYIVNFIGNNNDEKKKINLLLNNIYNIDSKSTTPSTTTAKKINHQIVNSSKHKTKIIKYLEDTSIEYLCCMINIHNHLEGKLSINKRNKIIIFKLIIIPPKDVIDECLSNNQELIKSTRGRSTIKRYLTHSYSETKSIKNSINKKQLGSDTENTLNLSCNNPEGNCFGSIFTENKCDRSYIDIKTTYYIKTEDVRLILKKSYYLRNSCLTIFTYSNLSYSFNFYNENLREFFILQLLSNYQFTREIKIDTKECKDKKDSIIGYEVLDNLDINNDKKLNNFLNFNNCNSCIFSNLLSHYIDKWINWKINNFDFLMILNLFSNRSYEDLSQYLVFPWILSSYSSNIFNSFNSSIPFFKGKKENVNNKLVHNQLNNNINTHLKNSQLYDKNNDKKKPLNNFYSPTTYTRLNLFNSTTCLNKNYDIINNKDFVNNNKPSSNYNIYKNIPNLELNKDVFITESNYNSNHDLNTIEKDKQTTNLNNNRLCNKNLNSSLFLQNINNNFTYSFFDYEKENMFSFIRNLSLPMGMMEIDNENKGKERKMKYLENYNNTLADIEEEQQANQGNKNYKPNKEPYFYGTHYSCPIYITHYMTRVFPYSCIMIELQGTKFDDPNRMFFNLNNSFKSSSTNKGDVRELIPEFFYLPEMFLNGNYFNMGIRTDEDGLNPSYVHNVELPTCLNLEQAINKSIISNKNSDSTLSNCFITKGSCKSLNIKNNNLFDNNIDYDLNNYSELKNINVFEKSINSSNFNIDMYYNNNINPPRNTVVERVAAYKFVICHKRILESEEISSKLNKWIDLIFGNKQRGKEAENAANLFIPSSYEHNISIENMEYEEYTYNMRLVEFGITPKQLIYPKALPSKNTKDYVRKGKQLTESYALKAFEESSLSKKIKSILLAQTRFDPLEVLKQLNMDKILKIKVIDSEKVLCLYNSYTCSIVKFIPSEKSFTIQPKSLPFNSQDHSSKISSKIHSYNYLSKHYIKQHSKNINYSQYYDLNSFTEAFIVNQSFQNSNKSIIIYGPNKFQYVAQCGYWDGKIVINDIINGKNYNFYTGIYPITILAIDKTEQYSFGGNTAGALLMFKIEDIKWTETKRIIGHNSDISCIYVSNNLNVVATTSFIGEINLYTFNNLELFRALNFNHLLICNIFISTNPINSFTFEAYDLDIISTKFEESNYSIDNKIRDRIRSNTFNVSNNKYFKKNNKILNTNNNFLSNGFNKVESNLYSFSINGQFLSCRSSETAFMVDPKVVTDISFNDYLVSTIY